MMSLTKVARILNLASLSLPGIQIREISIDSRQVKPGDLFIAIKGENFNGHHFMQEAYDKGAIGIICEKSDASINLPQLVVKDTIQALGLIAANYRQAFHCPIIAVTGSNGKTTVKEMIAACLPQPSLATQGNFNNHIGTPLSLLKLTEPHLYAVFELGANHVGEIAYTSNMVKPQVALINNIGPAHIGLFGSLDNIARTKGEIYQGLASSGIAIVNADDSYAHFWDEILQEKQIIRFSSQQAVEVYAENIQLNEQNCADFQLVLPGDSLAIQLKVPGLHSVQNALAAAACCHAVGITGEAIRAGLNQFKGVKGRMTYFTGKNQALIIDDTYNANLRSVLAAMEVLANYSGRKILVLGDIGELGEWTQSHHEKIGQTALQLGIDSVLTYGSHSVYTSSTFGNAGKHYSNQEKLACDLLTNLDSKTVVLVKGSRAAAMEKIVQQLVG